MSVTVRVPIVAQGFPAEKVIEHPTGAFPRAVGSDPVLEVRDEKGQKVALYAPGFWLSAEVKSEESD